MKSTGNILGDDCGIQATGLRKMNVGTTAEDGIDIKRNEKGCWASSSQDPRSRNPRR